MQTEQKRNYRDEIDSLINDNLDNSIFERMDALSFAHIETTQKTNGRFKEQFKFGYRLLMNALFNLNYVKKDLWPTYRSIQFIACTHNLKTLYSSFERLDNGYYTDSAILSRSPYEALIKIIYISIHNELSPHDVIIGAKSKGKPNFNLTNFLKDELKVDWSDYFLMSASAHANKYEVIRESIDIFKNGQTKPISTSILYDPFFYEIGLNQLTFLLYAYLKYVHNVLYTNGSLSTQQENKESALIDKFLELRELSTIETSPKPYWPIVFKDYNKIIDMIIEKDEQFDPKNILK